jgi:hypothetical protein
LFRRRRALAKTTGWKPILHCFQAISTPNIHLALSRADTPYFLGSRLTNCGIRLF